MGQSQGYSLGENISDSSEEGTCLKIGKVHIYVILVKGDTLNKAYIFQKVVVSHKEQIFPVNDCSAFLGARIWAQEIFS